MAVLLSDGSSLPGSGVRTRRRADRAALAAAVRVALGGAFRLLLVLTGMPPTSSDEATMALAVLHVAEGRHFPAYFYGQHYMGTLEAFLAAPLFRVAGPSLVALRLPLVPMYLVFGWLMYRLTRRLYTPWFAVAVVALLALGSHSVVHGQVFAGGGYPEIRPLGAGAMLLAPRPRRAQPPAARRVRRVRAAGRAGGVGRVADPAPRRCGCPAARRHVRPRSARPARSRAACRRTRRSGPGDRAPPAGGCRGREPVGDGAPRGGRAGAARRPPVRRGAARRPAGRRPTTSPRCSSPCRPCSGHCGRLPVASGGHPTV